jgi:hypothetical protein
LTNLEQTLSINVDEEQDGYLATQERFESAFPSRSGKAEESRVSGEQ